jgi:hypothetical protein
VLHSYRGHSFVCSTGVRSIPAHPNALKSKNPFAFSRPRSRKSIAGMKPESEDKVMRLSDLQQIDIVILYVSIRQVLISPHIYHHFQGCGSCRCWEKRRRQLLTTYIFLTKLCVQFINTLLGTSKMAVDHGSPSTVTRQHTSTSNVPSHPSPTGHRIVIVDTPGFDDPSAFHKRISSWLASP